MSVATPTGRARISTATTTATSARWRKRSRRSRGQCGTALGLGHDVCLDLVSRPDAFARLWRKLRAGYLLDALERLDGRPTSAVEVEALIERVDGLLATRQPSAGLGEDVRLRGQGVIGSGLELEGELIQLSAFRSRDGGERAFGRIARPSRRRG